MCAAAKIKPKLVYKAYRQIKPSKQYKQYKKVLKKNFTGCRALMRKYCNKLELPPYPHAHAHAHTVVCVVYVVYVVYVVCVVCTCVLVCVSY